MKKAIKKLKREMAYLNDAHNAIHSFTAYQSQDIDEFKRQNQTNKELIGILNEKLNSVILRADNISKLQSEIKTIAKHVQNLEAEKCSCKTNTPKAEFDKELFGKIFAENFNAESIELNNSTAIHEMMHKGKSIEDVVKKSVQSVVAKATAKTIADMVIHTNSPKSEMKAPYEQEYTDDHINTQKTDKNATEGKQEGKKEYLETTCYDGFSELTQSDFEALKLKARSQAHYETELKKAYDNCFKYYDKTGNVIDKPETIVTNEMFNEELEKRLSESFIQDHPAFMLLNGFIPSNTIEDLIRAKLKSKGEHYSPNGDRYSNFKRLNNSTASFKQKTVRERIENFMEKHEIWIEDYQAGDVNGTLLDLIESCIDVLCYYLLLDIYLKFNGEVKNG